MGDIEVGKCEVCGKDDVQLLRTYINFPFIECKCHNTHSILIRHCSQCTAKVPEETKIDIGVDELRAIDYLISKHEEEYKKSLAWFKQDHHRFRNCDERPSQHSKVSNSCEAMYMSD